MGVMANTNALFYNSNSPNDTWAQLISSLESNGIKPTSETVHGRYLRFSLFSFAFRFSLFFGNQIECSVETPSVIPTSPDTKKEPLSTGILNINKSKYNL